MERIQTESPNNAGLVEVISICGFALFYAWHLITALWLAPAYASGLSQPMQIASQAVFHLGAAAATVVLSRETLFRRMAGHLPRRAFLLTFLTLGCLPPAFCLIGIDAEVGYGIFNSLLFAAGVSTVYFFAIWEDIGLKIEISNPVEFIATSFCIGVGLFLVARYAFDGQCSPVGIICLACGAFLYWLVRRNLFLDRAEDLAMEEDDEKPTVSSASSPSRHFLGTGILFVPLGMSFGFALGILSVTARTWILALSLVSGCSLCIALLARLKRTGRIISIETLETVCAGAIASAFIIVMAGRSSTSTLVGLCIVVVAWLLFRSLNGGLLARHAMKNGLSSARSLAAGKVGVNVGIAIGWMLACVLSCCGMSEDVLSMILAPLAILVIALVLLHLSLSSAERCEGTGAKPQSNSIRAFMVKCMKVADLYKLSPREGEILCYLARGRNAKHIAEDLVISEHTAKSHIYRIYRKMDVHSRQGLIDLIEASFPDEADGT